MKFVLDVDERNRIEIERTDYITVEAPSRVFLTIFHRMESGTWVVNGGASLTLDKAASLALSLIDQAGKDKQFLKAKFQRKD